MNNISALPLIGSSYIKDDKLLELTALAFAGSDANVVNIYIDLYSVFDKLMTPVYELKNRTSDYEIASAVINMIAHYRAFFWKKLNVETRFFFVYSVNTPASARTFFPEYNNNFSTNILYSKDKMNFILQNLNTVELMMPYIADACITVGSFETSVIMHNIMEIENSPYPNIVITKDILTMQVCTDKRWNTVIYRPKKYKGEDISYVITPKGNGLFKHLAVFRKVKEPNLSIEIDSGFYSLVLAMVGDKSRNITSVLSYPKTMKIIETVLKKGKILNGYNNDIMYFIEELEDKDRNILLSNNILNRFKAIDMYFQYNLYLNNPERFYYKGIQNLYDPVGFHTILEEKFRDCPIDVERL